MIEWLQQAVQRLRSVFRRRQLEQELDAELSAHLELAIEENLQRGMSADEARRQAMIRLGGIQQAKEHHRDARGLPSLDILLQDLRYAVRGILRRPGFTTAAVVTLALGIAVNTTMFSLVSAFLLRPPPGRKPERVVVMSSVNPASNFLPDVNPVSAPNYLAWREATDFFTIMAAAHEYNTVSLTLRGQTSSIDSAEATPDYFSVLDVSPQLGRTFFAGDDQPGHDHVVILSHQLWEREFGSDASLIGRSIRINRGDYTVIGVMPASFNLIGFIPQLWTPLVLKSADQSAAAHKNRFLRVFARLKPGVTLEQVQAEMKTLERRAEKDFPETEKGWGIAARTLPDFLIYDFSIRSGLALMMTAVGFVLLIACANVAGLLLARVGERRKELAIRLSLGASRLRIVRQLLTEGLLIALLGGGTGLLLAYWGIRFVQAHLSFNEVMRAVEVSLDWNVLLFALSVSLLSAVLCGLAPALTASKTDINTSLKDEGRAASAGRSRGRLRNLLVIGEIALALCLLIGTGLLVRGIFLVEHQNLGFQPEHLLTASLNLYKARYPDASQQSLFVQNLLPRLQQIPGVEAVAAVSALPATGAPSIALQIKGQPELPAHQRLRALDVVATADYFRAADIPLVRGRTFTEMDNANANAPRVVVVNQEFVHRNLKDQDALGKQIQLDVDGPAPVWSEIVGVVGNVKSYSEGTRDEPEVYEPLLQRPLHYFYLMVRTNADPASQASALRKAVAEMDVELPLASVLTMDAVIESQRGGDPFFLSVLSSFALLALVLSAIGIYGLIAYSVGQRTHEIAIRMALGARSGNVRRMVLWQGMKMTAIGAAIGLAMALPLPKVFDAMFVDLHLGEAWLYVIVPIAIVLVAMLATFIPARRASNIDPMMALHDN